MGEAVWQCLEIYGYHAYVHVVIGPKKSLAQVPYQYGLGPLIPYSDFP